MSKIVQELKALLAFCNEVTGANDSRIGEAIKRLADGFKK